MSKRRASPSNSDSAFVLADRRSTPSAFGTPRHAPTVLTNAMMANARMEDRTVSVRAWTVGPEHRERPVRGGGARCGNTRWGRWFGG